MPEKRGKNYTIEDMARELGVSKTTVSRALSGKGRIGKATTERVLAFAELNGYRPNVIAKSLAQNKTYNLGLVIPVECTSSEVSFFNECMEGICEEASRYDYDVVVSISRDGSLQQVGRLVRNHKVDGIILTRTIINSDMVRFLKEQKIPFLVIGPLDDKDVVSVDNPNHEASRELTNFLLMKGFHRLALLGGNSQHYVTESRRGGFLDAHRKMGIMVNHSLVFMEVEDYRSALWAVEHVLAVGADGIVCMDDSICNLVLGCLRERNIEVPSKIRLASMYDSYLTERNDPPVTSLRFHTKELGRSACIKMLEMLGESVDERKPSVGYQVILRESTK